MAMPNTFRDSLAKIVDPDHYSIFSNLASRLIGSQRVLISFSAHGQEAVECNYYGSINVLLTDPETGKVLASRYFDLLDYCAKQPVKGLRPIVPRIKWRAIGSLSVPCWYPAAPSDGEFAALSADVNAYIEEVTSHE